MGSIVLKTELPGPKSREINARRAAAVCSAVAKSTEIVSASASGALVTDVDGNTLIDLAGGIGMLAAGHCPPTVVAAIQKQAANLIHPCFLVSTYEPYVELCEMLNASVPGDYPKKSILVNSGSEAVENAVKLARCYTKRQGIVVFEGAYHGRTLLTLSMTSKYGLFKKGFGPYASEIYRLPAPNPYRIPPGMSGEDYIQWCCGELEKALISHIDPSALAAIVIEPIQGEAGFIPIPCPFLHKIREICTRHGAVMIADEIQCGMGRTGKLWAIENYHIVPDLIVSGKSIASGMPIAAVTGRADIMDATHLGGAGGTYSGSPLACVAGIESLKIINTPEFLDQIRHKGEVLRTALDSWREKYPLIGDSRGLGAMRLVEFVSDRKTKEPAPTQALEVIREAMKGGVMMIRAGLFSNCIRFLPPMTITDDELHEALGIVEKAIATVQARQ